MLNYKHLYVKIVRQNKMGGTEAEHKKMLFIDKGFYVRI